MRANEEAVMEPGYALYHHRRDDSVRYEARKTAEGYEVKRPGDSAAWMVDAEVFEESYEPTEEE